MVNSDGIGAKFKSPELIVSGTIQAYSEKSEPTTLTISDFPSEISSAYIIWSDSYKEKISSKGSYSYTYSSPGMRTVNLEITDENGSSRLQSIGETEVSLFVGDAPMFYNFFEPSAWRDAWTSPGLKITHKADYTDTYETWSEVSFDGWDSSTIGGIDITMGSLGVSGNSGSYGYAYQLLTGREALKFSLDQPAHVVEIKLTDLVENENGSNDEVIRVQLFKKSGALVSEQIFSGDDDGIVLANLQSESSFSLIVITVGAYSGDVFRFGWHATDSLEGVMPQASEGSDALISSVKVRYSIPK